jgi:hypothetical protein
MHAGAAAPQVATRQRFSHAAYAPAGDGEANRDVESVRVVAEPVRIVASPAFTVTVGKLGMTVTIGDSLDELDTLVWNEIVHGARRRRSPVPRLSDWPAANASPPWQR